MQYDVLLLEHAQRFIATLAPKFRAKSLRTIELLAQFGPQLSMPHARKLKGYELWELRVRIGSDICRLFYFFHRERVYVITSGYVKKTDRTSDVEIRRAVRLREEHIAQEGDK